MAFVNERVPDQDVQKYGMRAVNARYGKGDFDYRWTVDRDRDIYLRWMTYDREDIGRNEFSFFWKGALIPVRLYGKGEGVRGGKGSTTWKFGGWTLPDALKSQTSQVVADLKEALVAFKDAGVGSVITDHTAYFDF